MFIRPLYGDFIEVHSKSFSVLFRGEIAIAFSHEDAGCFTKKTFEGSPALNDYYSGIEHTVLPDDMFEDAVAEL